MPDRNSSNELVLELMREMLAERGKDMSEGLTLRSVDRRLVERNAQDDRRFDRLEDRLRKVETEQARTAGHVEGEDLKTPAFSFNIPGAPAPAKISKRPALPSWAKAALGPAAQWLGMVLVAVLVTAFSRCEASMPHVGPPAATVGAPPTEKIR